LLEQDICGFYISMNNVFAAQGGVAVHEMAHKGQGFSLGKALIFFIFLKVVFKVSIFAVL
jgi:hypothetical protein